MRTTLCLLLLSVLIHTCISCPVFKKGNKALLEETGKHEVTWPLYYQADFETRNTPDENDVPPYHPYPKSPDTRLTYGKVVYDYEIHAMHEYHYEYCLAIFEDGNHWNCSFLNVNQVAYLLSDSPQFGPCCILLEPWFPPAPTFFRKMFLVEDTTELNNTKINWWQLGKELTYPNGNFGYGVYNYNPHSASDKPQIVQPAAFQFPTGPGWTIQYFTNFKAERPDPSHWVVPDSCIGVGNCNWIDLYDARDASFNIHSCPVTKVGNSGPACAAADTKEEKVDAESSTEKKHDEL